MNNRRKKNKNNYEWKMVRTEHYQMIDVFMDGDKLIRNVSIVEIYERKRVKSGSHGNQLNQHETTAHITNRAPGFHMDLRKIPKVSYNKYFDNTDSDLDSYIDDNENKNVEQTDDNYFIGNDISCKGYKRINLGNIN